MLRLNDISVFQYKNYLHQQFQFNKKVIGIAGNNGRGKTNILDAIYYLCFTKSYFSKSDAANVHRGTQGMRIEGNFTRNDESEKIVCILRENGKKEVIRNGDEYKRFSSHIGQFPAVMIAPDDVELITGISETRRKYLDTLLCQLDHQYLQSLIDYSKVLQQRNSLLKAGTDRGYVDQSLLDILTEQLVKPGNYIFEYRRKFLSEYLPAVAKKYLQIAGTEEPVELVYYSPLFEDEFDKLLATFRQKDIMSGRTSIGVHRDDLELKLNNENFKNIASQGQRKSLLFALKLNEFEELKAAKGFPPILLLDDVFEKLDAGRIENLLHSVCVESGSQVFITDTHKQRLEQSLQKLDVEFQLIDL